MKHTKSRDFISRLQYSFPKTIWIRSFGDPEGTLLLQAKANKILRRRKGLPLLTSSTWRSSLAFLPSRGMARVSRLSGAPQVVVGGLTMTPLLQKILWPLKNSATADLSPPSVIEGPSALVTGRGLMLRAVYIQHTFGKMCMHF